MGERSEAFSLRRPDGIVAGTLSGDGRTTIFLHGWTLDRRMWRPQIDKVPGRLLMIDRRGSGESSAPADLDREIDDIDAIIDALGGEPVSLVGMSQGGRVALRYADARPERLRRLVLTGAPIDGSPFAPEKPIPIDAMRTLLDAGRIDDLRALWHAHPLMRFDGADDLRRLLDDLLVECRWGEVLAPSALSRTRADIFAKAAWISIPALFLYGEQDQPDLLASAQAVVDRNRAMQFETVQDAGHFVNWTHAAPFNARIGRWLAE